MLSMQVRFKLDNESVENERLFLQNKNENENVPVHFEVKTTYH